MIQDSHILGNADLPGEFPWQGWGKRIHARCALVGTANMFVGHFSQREASDAACLVSTGHHCWVVQGEFITEIAK